MRRLVRFVVNLFAKPLHSMPADRLLQPCPLQPDGDPALSNALSLPAVAVAETIEKQAKLIRVECARVRKENVDGIHDMRVTSRRLRVALREARSLLDADVYGSLQERLSGVTEALGHARELDVMTLMMEEYLKEAYGPWQRAAHHAINEMRGVREEARHGCAEAVRAPWRAAAMAKLDVSPP